MTDHENELAEKPVPDLLNGFLNWAATQSVNCLQPGEEDATDATVDAMAGRE